LKRIHIFRTGKHTATSGATLDFTEADLRSAAAAYDPAVHEAPLVIGHPAQDAPAFGWVKSLQHDGADLHASVDQVDAAFAEMVSGGKFKKVSASFYRPDAPTNPKPGSYYLRHVGFLGATPPAVKGLKAVEFAGTAEDSVTVEFGEGGWDMRTVARLMRGLRDFMIGQFGQEAADKALPDWDITWLNDEAVRESERTMPSSSFSEPPRQESPVSNPAPTATTAEQLAAREAQLSQQETALRQQVAAFAEKEAKARREQNAAFLDALIKDAKFPAARKDAALAFMDRLDAADVVSFGEGDSAPKATELDLFKDLLGAYPGAIQFGELAPTSTTVPSADELSAKELADKVTSFRAKKAAEGLTLSYAEALEGVKKELNT
jgi:hypothetical protein